MLPGFYPIPHDHLSFFLHSSVEVSVHAFLLPAPCMREPICMLFSPLGMDRYWLWSPECFSMIALPQWTVMSRATSLVRIVYNPGCSRAWLIMSVSSLLRPCHRTAWITCHQSSDSDYQQYCVFGTFRSTYVHPSRDNSRNWFIQISDGWYTRGTIQASVCESGEMFVKYWVAFEQCSKGHGTRSSGSSTPFISSGSVTPREEDVIVSGDNVGLPGYAGTLSEKLRHRTSFARANLAEPTLGHFSSSNGMSKEHTEQGQVKRDVYRQYIEAASKEGFFLFLLATVTQQAVSVLANLTLRNWGEHNREMGNNSGMFRYLLIYGLFSASSTLLGGAAAVLMWVLCALRSARYLHDSVCHPFLSLGACWWQTFHADVELCHTRSFELFRADSYWPVSFNVRDECLSSLTDPFRILNLFSRDTYVVDQILARVRHIFLIQIYLYWKIIRWYKASAARLLSAFRLLLSLVEVFHLSLFLWSLLVGSTSESWGAIQTNFHATICSPMMLDTTLPPPGNWSAWMQFPVHPFLHGSLSHWLASQPFVLSTNNLLLLLLINSLLTITKSVTCQAYLSTVGLQWDWSLLGPRSF